MGGPLRAGSNASLANKNFKSKTFFGGFWASKLHESFVYGKSFLGKSFSKKNWNPNPTQPKDIPDTPKKAGPNRVKEGREVHKLFASY